MEEMVQEVEETPIELVAPPEYHAQCRICKWSVDKPELYNWLATLALKGTAYTRMRTLLEEHLKINYPDIKCPTKKSVWQHFKLHIKPRDSVMMEVAKSPFITNQVGPLITPEAIKELERGDFDEYKELCALYVKFREVNDRIYEMAESLMSAARNGMKEWSQNKITTYVSMVNTQKSILSEIGKMRQGDKLVEVVSKFLMENYTRSIVTKLSEEFAALNDVLKRHNVDPQIIDAYQEITHARFGKIILDESDRAMTLAKKEFKLPM